ncbi:MAG TPA: hypothetical protein VFG73_01835 [Rhodanobacteraceae bacterium]|nr:hypothetical protein [Rhodanobacteraceae bacterium]
MNRGARRQRRAAWIARLPACALPLLIATAAAATAAPAAPAVLASAPAAPAASASAPAAQRPSQRQRLAAVNQYQHDLVSVLVLRADARHLLGAALLARPLRGQPDRLGYHALLQRAVEADDAGPAVRWAQLADCDTAAGNCPNDEALAALLATDADNAAPWLLKLALAVVAGDDAAAEDALAKAAAASRYDDYAGPIHAALVAAATALPVPAPVVREYAAGGPAGAPAVQAFLVFGAGSVAPRPNLLPAVQRCDPGQGAELDASRRRACHRLARLLTWGSSAQARAAGLHLQAALADDEAARHAAEAAQHNLEWQYRQFSRLRLRAMHHDALATELLKLARSGGTAMSMMLALLQQRDIPLQAPAAAASAGPP